MGICTGVPQQTVLVPPTIRVPIKVGNYWIPTQVHNPPPKENNCLWKIPTPYTVAADISQFNIQQQYCMKIVKHPEGLQYFQPKNVLKVGNLPLISFTANIGIQGTGSRDQ